MEEVMEKALSKGVEMHVAGEFDLARQLYESVVRLQPYHPDANHNMGLLKLDTENDLASLPYLRTALQADTSISQFWLSYIKALIKSKKMDEAFRIFELAKESGFERADFEKLHQSMNSFTKNGNSAGKKLFLNQTKLDLFDETELQNMTKNKLKLSKKGLKLINLYKDMVVNGYERTDGSKVTSTYNDFELRKFRTICKTHLQNRYRNDLDYGGGGSNWYASNFKHFTNESAKRFFKIKMSVQTNQQEIYLKRENLIVLFAWMYSSIYIFQTSQKLSFKKRLISK